MGKEQVTLKDIAKILNVSASTVSRALKDNPEIGEATRNTIKKLAAELNYQPNTVALSLRKKRTFTLGVVVPEIVHYFFSSVISGIEEAAFANGYQVVLCQSNEKYEHEVKSLNTLRQSQVDGILISCAKESVSFDHLVDIANKGIPVVLYDRHPENIDFSSVLVDDFGGGYCAVEYLIKTGCRRIVHLAGPVHVDIHKKRLEGYQKALEDHGITPDPAWVVEADNFKLGYEAIEILMKRKIDVDGIFAVNDLTAVGAMKGLKAMGIKVPQQVSVVGFGDDSTLSQMVDPTLTSVAQPGFEMGQAATQILLDHINGKINTPENRVLKIKLNARESTKPLR